MPCQNNKLKTGPNSTVARLPPGDHDGYLLVRLATVCGECVPASQQACQFSNMRPIVRTAVKWKQLRASRSGPTADRTTHACTPNMLAPPSLIFVLSDACTCVVGSYIRAHTVTYSNHGARAQHRSLFAYQSASPPSPPPSSASSGARAPA